MKKTTLDLYSGLIGDKVFRTVGQNQIVQARPAKITQPRTQQQMMHRCKWPNRGAIFRAYKAWASKCFEDQCPGMSAYNLFVKVNAYTPEVYITKEMAAKRACVAADYTVSNGSLTSINVEGTGASAVTNISLGGLTVTDSTTVTQFAKAVVTNNALYKHNDVIAFLMFRQETNAQTQMPTVNVEAYKVNLTLDDDRKLLDVVCSYGFSRSSDGRLAVSDAVPEGAYAWIHSRKTTAGKTLVSTQQLVVNNPLLADYTGEEACIRSMESYGLGEQAFITPDNAVSNRTESSTSTDSGSGGSSSGGGGSDVDPDNPLG